MSQPRHFGELILPHDRPYLIAEAGVNHENCLETAIKMVEEAASAGVDAIKFQSYKAETLASKQSPAYWDLESEPTTSQYELFKKLDHFGDDEYRALAEKAREVGIDFLSTPFDLRFADILEPLMPAYKIASADLTNDVLLAHVARKGKPVILSVGASTLAEVHEAVGVVRDNGNPPLALLHCVLSYPCRPGDANLDVIPTLAEAFPGCTVGYSDHVPPDPTATILTTAWLLGARILEKHFTLDKSKPGNDHYHAMDPDDVRVFRKQCALVHELRGAGRKDVLECEAAARIHARRSLVAGRELAPGDTLASTDLEIKRPGHGIAPRFRELIVGKKVRREVAEDEVLTWDVFMEPGSPSA